ncbi:MAG: hypothetical protein ACM32O_12765, partial [Clostridia bacterium]
MATFYHAYLAKEKLSRSMIHKNGIAGVGVGYVNPKNPKLGAGVVVYTTSNKVSITNAAPQSVQLSVKGSTVSVPVRTIPSGKFHSFADVDPRRFRERIRPVPAGYSVGHPEASGTAGLIVVNYPARTRLYICSNNHVLNKNNSTGYTETIQPGGADGGRTVRDRIGRLDRFVRLRRNGDNFLDAATSKPLRNSLLSPTYATVGVLPGHVRSYSVGDRFKKVGRTTGFVRGVVESINTDLFINYGKYGGLGSIRFRNQTVITSSMPISLPGDSGSVWLRAKDNFAAAVNFAGTSDGKRSIAYPVQWFMQVF